MNDRAALATALDSERRLGEVVPGVSHKIGDGFTALHFSKGMFGDGMSPLLMVDHFVMTAPTFDPHLHSGMSAVTVMFEDAVGDFLNRDTLGNNLALKAGDLYWLAAAGGAAHEERPDEGARTHALQIFVDLPEALKNKPACAFHIRAQEIPVISGEGHRVRVVLGSSAGVTGPGATPEKMTMLDGFLEDGGRFTHQVEAGNRAWIYALSGRLGIRCQGEQCIVESGAATTVQAGQAVAVTLEAGQAAHFVLIEAKPIEGRPL